MFVAPVDVVLSPHDIVQPDVAVVSRQNRAILTERNLRGPPDLVIEVLSPSTRSFDLGDKKDLYERSRVPEYWVVDGDSRELTAFRLDGQRYRPGVCTVDLHGIAGVRVDLMRVWG